MTTFDRDRALELGSQMGLYQKKVGTRAIRIKGPFQVVTREGLLTCPDGYLALDSAGFPYPVAADEFERIYDLVSVPDSRKPQRPWFAERYEG